MLPIGCKECGWGEDVRDEDMPLLCPRCHRPGLALDLLPAIDDPDGKIQRQFDQAQQKARERWRVAHSDAH